jgi:hypothetical protein
MDLYERRKGHTHYPVPGSFSVSKRARKNTGSLQGFMFALFALINAADRWRLMGNQGCDARIKLPVSTRLYITTTVTSGHVQYDCNEADTVTGNTDVRHRRAAASESVRLGGPFFMDLLSHFSSFSNSANINYYSDVQISDQTV